MTRTGAERPKPFRPGLRGSAPGGDPSRRRVQEEEQVTGVAGLGQAGV
jgi:hypothetical protein